MSYFIKHFNSKLVFLSLAILLSSCEQTDPQTQRSELQQYNAARQEYKSQRYNNAISAFNAQLTTYPNGNLADNAILYLGRSFYWLKNYRSALKNFQVILSDYKDGSRADAATYWIAKTYHAQANQDPITTTFEQVRTAYNLVTSVTYIDNAAYQIGRTYLDEANQSSKSDPSIAAQKLDTATLLLASMITDYANPPSSSIDDAQFYLGRSYHELASLVANDANLSSFTSTALFSSAHSAYNSPLISATSTFFDDSQYFDGRAYHDQKDYINARTAYNLLITARNSSLAEDAKYQFAKTYYDEAVQSTEPQFAYDNFIIAITHFSDFETDVYYSNSSRGDDAAYFRARSYHRQATIFSGNTITTTNILITKDSLFEDSRINYQFVIDNFTESGWRDNAQYQMGATYFDEADFAKIEMPANYQRMQTKLADAISAFTRLVSDPTLQLLNSADNAQYYLGRSYQQIADLAYIALTDATAIKRPVVDRNGNLVTDVDVIHQTAIDAYTRLLQDQIFSNSAWKDNAVYRIGTSYFTEAKIESAKLLVNTATVTTSYTNAINSLFSLFSDNQYSQSTRRDNAALAIGSIYQITQYCNQETLWFDYLTNTLNSALTPPVANNICNFANNEYVLPLVPPPFIL